MPWDLCVHNRELQTMYGSQESRQDTAIEDAFSTLSIMILNQPVIHNSFEALGIPHGMSDHLASPIAYKRSASRYRGL